MEEKKFVSLTENIVSIIRMSNALVKLKGNDPKLEEELKMAMEKDSDNLEKVCAYVFYLWFHMDNQLDLEDANAVFKVSINVVDIIDGVLLKHPEYWILAVLKYRIRSFMNFEEKTLVMELKNLVEEQRKRKYPPYFLVTDVLLSFAYFSLGDFNLAKKSLEEIFQVYQGKVTSLPEFFGQFIDEYRNIIHRSPDGDILDLLNKVDRVYF